MQIPIRVVWFREAERPMVAYCRRCDTIGVVYWSEDHRLHCGVCATCDLSIFVWDPKSASPTEDPTFEDRLPRETVVSESSPIHVPGRPAGRTR